MNIWRLPWEPQKYLEKASKGQVAIGALQAAWAKKQWNLCHYCDTICIPKPMKTAETQNTTYQFK